MLQMTKNSRIVIANKKKQRTMDEYVRPPDVRRPPEALIPFDHTVNNNIATVDSRNILRISRDSSRRINDFRAINAVQDLDQEFNLDFDSSCNLSRLPHPHLQDIQTQTKGAIQNLMDILVIYLNVERSCAVTNDNAGTSDLDQAHTLLTKHMSNTSQNIVISEKTWHDSWVNTIEENSSYPLGLPTMDCFACADENVPMVNIHLDHSMCLKCVLKTYFSSSDNLQKSFGVCPFCREVFFIKPILIDLMDSYPKKEPVTEEKEEIPDANTRSKPTQQSTLTSGSCRNSRLLMKD